MNFFDQLLDNTEAKTVLWKKEASVSINEEIDFSRDNIAKKLAWIENNKDNIILFALEAEDFLANFNDFVSKELVKKGKCRLPDGMILMETIDAETLEESIFINSVHFYDEETFEINLVTSPDYFGMHTLSIEVSGDEYEMEFAGMNG
ncbi:hypothetical protein [Listeria seeligeri]|uniref:hypothetical protein n=1 Tax=Listeria seeligeri TaxID=1640 RepID=UPI0022EBC4EB|nr:hypothetical protein [Listeria seeligeri]